MPIHEGMTLVEEAERAEKIRNAFIVFTGPCAEDHDTILDINQAISELSSLSCALRRINKLIDESTEASFEEIHSDLTLVHDDVTFTLGDIWHSLGRLGRNLTPYDYQHTWEEIADQAAASSQGKRLHRVLEYYRKFLDSLSKKLETHVFSPTLDEFRPAISGIHARRSPQPQLPPSRPVTPRVGRSGSRRKTSARPRPSSRGNSQRDLAPRSPELKKSWERKRPMSPDASSTSSISDATKIREKPWMPSPPMSPTGTISSISQVSNAPSLEATANHWAKSVFKHVSSTPLPWSDEETRYHEIAGIREHSRPNHLYDSVLNLMYPEGVRVSLMCRASDYRAKCVVYYRDRSGRQEYGCLPLSDLHLRREGSILRVCRMRSNGSPQPWVTMKFTTIERMTLFAGTFIAMRSQDASTQPPVPVIDDELREEVSEFAGRISDSGFTHALRIWRDKVTHSIRLQASVFQGELDRTPVWTAFITHFITSQDWARRIDRKTVALADLKLHNFSARYRPVLAPSGAFMLKFETKEDCEAFMEVIEFWRERLTGYDH